MKILIDTETNVVELTSNASAAAQFVQRHSEFVIEQRLWPFNERELTDNVTRWPGAWLRRKAE